MAPIRTTNTVRGKNTPMLTFILQDGADKEQDAMEVTLFGALASDAADRMQPGGCYVITGLFSKMFNGKLTLNNMLVSSFSPVVADPYEALAPEQRLKNSAAPVLLGRIVSAIHSIDTAHWPRCPSVGCYNKCVSLSYLTI